ncbi:glycoside hydrolase family 3 C-terminal domain-containing protein [Streptomyces sp. NPDC051940]|uniref:glycoside hydrolase family 3 protein n=1 Tax=Streptomyces sp. NPDC051940 TaxID=3155675 RepID=UPI00342E8A8F
MGARGDDAVRAEAVERALARLGLDARCALLGGADMWSLPAHEAIGLGRLVMSDGPAGVRGEHWTPDDPSVALPSPTALAASWDPELVRRAGRLLAQEARRKGAHVVLAPTVNLHRTPRGGRHFEAYAEDPLLTGVIGAALVAGVQDGGVGTTPKHFTANDSETDRYTVDVTVDGTTLRELYLEPFERIVRTARPWGLMTAYNSVGGTTMSEHHELNNQVLRGEWGFDGFLVSDWTAARDTVGAANGGNDIAMPGPDTVFGARLAQAVRAGKVTEAVVESMARRVLTLAARAGLLDGAPPAVAEGALPPDVDGEALARELAARSFVLLRNDDVLPLPTRPGRIAVIGRAAARPRIGGGGSAEVFPTRLTTPLRALRDAVDGEVVYVPGPDPRERIAPAAFPLRAVLRDRSGAVLHEVGLPEGQVRWLGALPGGVAAARVGSVELRGSFTPGAGGTHQLAIRGVGEFRLAVGGRAVFDGPVLPEGSDPGAAFLNPPQRVVPVELAAGEPVDVSLVYRMPPAEGLLAVFAVVAFELGHREPVRPAEDEIAEAVAAAADADVAVVFVGTTDESESEGADRATLALPGAQDLLVSRVAAANPRTVVVVNAGAPVLMPWREEVAALLLAWFPGQEGGAALADVLTGAAEPTGRLTTTWPAADEDAPVWRVKPGADGTLPYEEGLFVGYRAWRRAGTRPAYWFGEGDGYTSWSYDELRVVPRAFDARAPYAPLAEVTVRVRNTGARRGRETVQVYLSALGDDPRRPDLTLAGFAVVEADPGEEAQARVLVPLRAAQNWDGASHAWVTRGGMRTVRAGRSVAELPLSAVLEVTPPM